MMMMMMMTTAMMSMMMVMMYDYYDEHSDDDYDGYTDDGNIDDAADGDRKGTRLIFFTGLCF